MRPPLPSQFALSLQTRGRDIAAEPPIQATIANVPATAIATLRDPLEIMVAPGLEGEKVSDVTVYVNDGIQVPTYDDPIAHIAE